MKPIAIEFASEPSWKRTLYLGTLGLGALALTASVWQYFSLESAIDRAEIRYRMAADRAARRVTEPVPSSSFSIPAAQVQAINAAISKLNIPWSELFAVLEETKPAQVALLSIEPDPKKRRLVILAESKTPADMLEFAERFRLAPFFDDAFLTKHELREQDPNKPYRFSVELRWSDEGDVDVSP